MHQQSLFSPSPYFGSSTGKEWQAERVISWQDSTMLMCVWMCTPYESSVLRGRLFINPTKNDQLPTVWELVVAANSSHHGRCSCLYLILTRRSLAVEEGKVRHSTEHAQNAVMCESKRTSGVRMDAQVRSGKQNGCSRHRCSCQVGSYIILNRILRCVLKSIAKGELFQKRCWGIEKSFGGKSI